MSSISTRRLVSFIPVLVGLACACTAAGATTLDDPAAPTTQPATQPGTTLGGPKVGEGAAGKSTLIEKDFDGTLNMLEVRPEVAALRLLKLSDVEKAATDKVLQERGALVAKVLKENYALFLELQNMRQAGAGGGAEGGDREKAREQRRGMMEKMQTFREKAKDLLEPTLLQQLSKDLSASNAEELKRLVQDYNAAAMESQRAGRGAGRPNGGGGGEGGGMGGARGEFAPQRMEINQTLREIGRSLKSVVDERKDRADAILKAANATPEQEAKIRAIFREMGGQAAVGAPSEQDRGAAMRKVLEVLTPEQREAVLKEIRR